MFGLTPLGVFHTLVGLIGVVCGVIALARDKQISPRTRLGRVYLLGTLIAAVSALGIFRRGAFGPAHVLALLTIAALALGTLAGRSSLFGRVGVTFRRSATRARFSFSSSRRSPSRRFAYRRARPWSRPSTRRSYSVSTSGFSWPSWSASRCR